MAEPLLLLACCIPGCGSRLLVPPEAPPDEIRALVAGADWACTFHAGADGQPFQFTICTTHRDEQAAQGLEPSEQIDPPPTLRYRCGNTGCANMRASITPEPDWAMYGAKVSVGSKPLVAIEIRCPHCTEKLNRIAARAMKQALVDLKL